MAVGSDAGEKSFASLWRESAGWSALRAWDTHPVVAGGDADGHAHPDDAGDGLVHRPGEGAAERHASNYGASADIPVGGRRNRPEVVSKPLDSASSAAQLSPCTRRSARSRYPQGGKPYGDDAGVGPAAAVAEDLDADDLALLSNAVLLSADGAGAVGSVPCRRSVRGSVRRAPGYPPFLSVFEEPGTALWPKTARPSKSCASSAGVGVGRGCGDGHRARPRCRCRRRRHTRPRRRSCRTCTGARRPPQAQACSRYGPGPRTPRARSRPATRTPCSPARRSQPALVSPRSAARTGIAAPHRWPRAGARDRRRSCRRSPRSRRVAGTCA